MAVGSVEPARLIASAITKKTLHHAAAGIVEIDAAPGLVKLVDDGGRAVRLTDGPGASIDYPLREIADRGDERGIGKTGIIGDHHRRHVVDIVHRLHVKDRVRGVADEQNHIRIFILELEDLRRDIG